MSNILILIHGIFALFLFAMMGFRALKVPMQMWPVMFLIPYLGEIIVLAIHIHTVRGLNGKDFRNVFENKQDDEDIDSGFFRKAERDASLPLEDALITYKGRKRQEILRGALLNSQQKRTELLEQARSSNDPEIVHFATTAMAKERTDMEMMFSAYENKLAHPGNMQPEKLQAVQGKYIDALHQYLKTASSSDPMYGIRQEKLITLLEERIQIPSLQTPQIYVMLAECYLDRRNFDAARKILNQTDLIWPGCTDAWIQRLRMLYMKKDKAGMDRLIRNYHAHPDFQNKRIDEVIQIWEED